MKSTVTPLPAGWFVVLIRVTWDGGVIVNGEPRLVDFQVAEERYAALAIEHSPPRPRADLPLVLRDADHRLIVCGGPAIGHIRAIDELCEDCADVSCCAMFTGPWHDEHRPLDKDGHGSVRADLLSRVQGWVRTDLAVDALLEHLLGGPASCDELRALLSLRDAAYRGADVLKQLRARREVVEHDGTLAIHDDWRTQVAYTFGVELDEAAPES